MLEVSAHKVVGAEQRSSPNRGGPLEAPTILVLHFTAGPSFAGAMSWLCNPLAKASAHLVIGRAAELGQLVPLNVVAWHAGASMWKGRSRVNERSIGIELVNAGKLRKRGEHWFPQYAWKRDPKTGVLRFVEGSKPTPDSDVYVHTDGTRWHAYTEPQLCKLDEATAAVLGYAPTITEIVGHEDVAPKRKTDPGPAFPWERFGGHRQRAAGKGA